MNASVRELKAHLSAYIRKARAGQPVIIRIHDKPVARITAIEPVAGLQALAGMPGIRWNGGKPSGLPLGERISRKNTLAARVIEDRR